MEELKSKSRHEIERLQSELQDSRECDRGQTEEMEQTLKERDEELKNIKNTFEKELAIFKQKIEFKEVQSMQLK